jgi:TonB family protein
MSTEAPEIRAGTGAGHHSVAQTLALLHPWIDFVPQPQRRLGLFICLALAIHFAAFFFIRIDATRAELQHVPRTHVTVENVNSAAGADDSDAFWDELTDPRLFLLPAASFNRISTDELPPDFTAIDSRLGTGQLPPPAGTVSPPLAPVAAPSLPEQVAAELHPARQPFSYDETPPVTATRTAWQLDAAFDGRQPAVTPELPSPVSNADLSPTELRIAVGPDGTVQHVLLEETCQNPDLDQQAVRAAMKLRFGGAPQPGLQWGRVTIFWNIIAPPREVVEPTPPTAPSF